MFPVSRVLVDFFEHVKKCERKKPWQLSSYDWLLKEEYTQEIGALIYLIFFGNPWAVPFKKTLCLGFLCFFWFWMMWVGGRGSKLVVRITPFFRHGLRPFARGPTTRKQTMVIYFWVLVSNIVYFHPYLGKWSYLTNMFQRGWFNHQLVAYNPLTKRHRYQKVGQ